MKNFVVFLAIFLSFPSLVRAEQRVVNFREGMQIEVTITSEYATEVVFPDNIAKVIPGISSQYLSWEQVLNRLYLQLVSYAPKGSMIVVTQDGFSYPLLVSTSETGSDKSVKVINPEAESIKTGFATGNRLLDMMKSMITHSYAGFKVEDTPALPEVWKDENIIMLLEKKYTSSEYTGYVLQVINITDQPVVIPIQQIYLKGLLAVCADDQVLEKKGHAKSITTMYIITEKD